MPVRPQPYFWFCREWGSTISSLSPDRKAPAAIGEDCARGVMARRAGDTAPRMRARATEVESLERAAIVGIAEHRTRPEQLVERQGAVKDVAAGQAEHLLEIERRQRLVAEHARLKPGSVAIDRIDHQIGHRVAMLIPGTAVRQFGGNVLAEQAGDVRAVRRQCVVEGRWDQHLDDGLAT